MPKTEITDADIYDARAKAHGYPASDAAQMARRRNYDFMLYNGMVVDVNNPLSASGNFAKAVVYTPSRVYFGQNFEFKGWKEPLHYTGSNPSLKNA